ncbi:sodium:solute symporter family protein [Endozoicomonas ascidiicola]|uniref:sodium:solute symporter family protein n=1 Tax=Endozoicomonas ascidiicola TaxID=1698521 RepID=UPI00082962D1|nr:sodium:solute symporter family protein [Endozoicomonas ascidiicola]
MSPVTYSLLAIALYLLLLIPACVKANRCNVNNTASEHYLADRSLGFLVLLLTIYATTISGNILGLSGQAYKAGYLWVIYSGMAAGITTAFHWLVPKLRPLSIKHQFVTPGDWVRFRFGEQENTLRILVTVVLIAALGNYLFAQLKAAGEIVAVMTENTISYETGVISFTLIIFAYDVLGGLRAVAWTDMIQGLIMIIGFSLLGIWIIDSSGGLDNLAANINQFRPESTSIPTPDKMTKWFSLIIMTGLAITIYPQTLQRIFAASSDQSLYRALAALGILSFLTSLVALLTGWSAIALFPFESALSADQVLPRLLEHWGTSSIWNRVASVLVLLAILAAIMSTADSVLLSLVSIIRRDLKTTPQHTGLFYDKILTAFLMIMVTLLALNRDITLWRLLELKLEILVQCVPVFFIALHWRHVSSKSILIGLCAGLLTLTWLLAHGYQSLQGISSGLVALGVNISLVILCHIFTVRLKPIKQQTPTTDNALD